MTRLLLVSPVFHGYSHSIAAAFERLGHEVTVFHYDARSRLDRLWHKAASNCRPGCPGARARAQQAPSPPVRCRFCGRSVLTGCSW